MERNYENLRDYKTRYDFKVRQAFDESCHTHASVIMDEDEWNQFTASLLRMKLASIDDVDTIERNKPCIPCDFATLN